ncbi:MAG: PASTA domain-containing protein [Bacteroidales bacterium]|nr:PASTA domain-containing protein [Bacteroidales bacterium]MCB9013161.1 PASTA domain-containing protein [Bacteroidales bacterium]
MDFLKFLLTRVFFKNLLIAIAIALFLLITSLIGLRIFTRHGRALTVPDLTGLSLEEVDFITKSKNLRYNVTDSVFFKELPKGTVVKQNPRQGSKVKANRTIYLSMNAMNPERVTMPTVTGVSLRQARAILETYGLNLGKISYRPDIAVNNVLQQMVNDTVIQPGSLIIKGSSVNLVLGRGLSDQTTPVPNLIGKDVTAAKGLLADRYLNSGALVYDNSILNAHDSLFAFVWKQRPDAEDDQEVRLQLGSNVDLWITVDSTKLPQPDSLLLEKSYNPDEESF